MATALDRLSSQHADLPRFLRLRPPSPSSSQPHDPVAQTSDEPEGAAQILAHGNSQRSTSRAGSSASSSSHLPLLVPPLNFQNVTFGISRSGHPNERNYEFLRRMRLKTIMYIATDDYRPKISSFAEEEGIRLLHFRITVNKEPFAEMEQDIVAEALSQALDKRNYPLLIHCNKGKARVGVFTGLIRRLQGWSHTSIFEEYARFAGSKALDEEFIGVFDLSTVRIDPEHKPDWL